MSFTNAHNFTITNFSAVDNGDRGVATFQHLVQEACLGAGHRSTERFDPPKCHPETREAVLNDIMSWVDSAVSKEHIMWMSGPAGAGKSSIAQTICDRCHGESKLLASFFFSRTATGTSRDDGNKLVPTIACQLAAAIPESKSFIVKALDDPAVLSYSMDVQMKKLVLEPLSEVYASVDSQSTSNNISLPLPYLVVIDGLDECNGSEMQSKIIQMIATIFSDMHIHPALRVLVASRPELEIRNTFDIEFVSRICAPRIVLDEKYGPDDDIRVYLESEFASLKREHTLKLILLEDSNWPTPDNIKMLVERSSGQFIYAATIIKYLKHPRRDPRDVLKSIINYGSNAKDNNALFNESPFLQLDALYMQVLKTAFSNLQSQTDSFVLVFQILSESYYADPWLKYLDPMASFMSMDRTKLRLLLSDLHSVISIPEDSEYSVEDIKFYHASFEDFLKDSSRSGGFHIGKKESHCALAHCCFTMLSQHQSHNRLTKAEQYSRRNYFSHIKYSGFNHTLLKELHNTSKLQVILDLILDGGLYFDDDDKHCWEELGAFFYFRPFEIPAIKIKSENKQIQALCDRIVESIDEFITPSDSSVDDTDGTLVDAIVDLYAYDHLDYTMQYCSYKYSWLLWMLQTPERGKHRYLDSNECMRLYTKFCSTSEYETYSKDSYTRYLRPFVLQYLLRRIEPSADINLDVFREMSRELTNDETVMEFDDGLVEKFLQSVDEFIQKCVELKQNCLKRKLCLTATEEQPSKLSRIDRLG